MQTFKFKRGLDLPVSGAPAASPSVSEVHAPDIRTVAVLGADYIGLKPRLEVQEGDKIGAGAPIFYHKDTPEIMVTAPASGRVRAINRGARRVLISVEIDIDPKAAKPVSFAKVGDAKTREGLVKKLCASGLWTSFRTRPYSKVPEADATTDAIFVTAMDTEPLAADPAQIIAGAAEEFEAGLAAITKLTDGKVYVCRGAGAEVPGQGIDGVEMAEFDGPHPAGLAGTHIHFLHPVTAEKAVWTIGYQDVIAIGHMLKTGHNDAERVIALAGPRAANPRLLRVPAGASMLDITENEAEGDAPLRLISGSILSGRMGSGSDAYLGRYARQVTMIEEDHKQIPMGWIRPMFSKYAFQPVLGSAISKKLYGLTSNLNGGRRAMVPIGTFEKLMPQDFLPTQLLRSLLVMDTDTAQQLGALELDEEDLGLVGFACPAKYEYGIALRDCLSKIEKEG
ncbi:MAG: Na(+)-translocating NADH-quinone reductase subunit A [Pseudomonadota bacterium]